MEEQTTQPKTSVATTDTPVVDTITQKVEEGNRHDRRRLAFLERNKEKFAKASKLFDQAKKERMERKLSLKHKLDMVAERKQARMAKNNDQKA